MAGEERGFGYRQELERTMGGFSSFAVSFSLISVLTGLFANFNFGLREAGTWIIASWTLVAAGQYLIARVMAGLSRRFPLAGYGYQWTARLVNPHFGFFIGWMLLVQFLTGFPGIIQAAAATLAGLAGWQTGPEGILALSLCIISLVTLVHLNGIRAAARVNDIGVYAEMAGIVLLTAALAWACRESPTPPPMAGGDAAPTGMPGLEALAHSLLLGAWCLTGFEAAADLAEETHAPRRHVPRAVTGSLLSAAAAGLLILTLLLWSADDLEKTRTAQDPLTELLEAAIGSGMSVATRAFVLVSMLACGVASMATASRLMFSMARDGMLPGSRKIAQVHAASRSPRTAMCCVWAFSTLALLLFRRLEVITSISALASFIGYAGMMYAAYLEGRKPLPLLALAWAIAVVAALALPETPMEGWGTRHLPAISTAGALLAGILTYLLYVRPALRKGQAGPPPIREEIN